VGSVWCIGLAPASLHTIAVTIACILLALPSPKSALQPNVRINTTRHIASSSDSKSLAHSSVCTTPLPTPRQRIGSASTKIQKATTTLHLFACATFPAAIDPREKIRLTSCHTHAVPSSSAAQPQPFNQQVVYRRLFSIE
jgi:hypothetical protein